jgi:hypothetical protein
MPKAVGQLNNNWQNILILGLPASKSWMQHGHGPCTRQQRLSLCTIQLGSVQYSKLQHWCAAMMIFSKVLWFLKLGDLSPQKKNNLA